MRERERKRVRENESEGEKGCARGEQLGKRVDDELVQESREGKLNSLFFLRCVSRVTSCSRDFFYEVRVLQTKESKQKEKTK